ncbi:MAG: hypothetical protein R3C26_21640 [Calditrichia bacterium]
MAKWSPLNWKMVAEIPCRAIVLTCGTLFHIGLNNMASGRAGEKAVKG